MGVSGFRGRVGDPLTPELVCLLATAFGADGMLTDHRTADPFSRRTLRVSTGSALKLPIRLCQNLADDITRLRDDWQFEVAGAVLDQQAVPLQEVTRPDRLILMLGNETNGLADDLVDLCDHRWTIPMTDLVNSINVSAAAGIFLYTVFAQAQHK